MRIVQLLPELNEGGVERGVVELSRELVKGGADSWVISAGGRLAEQIQADGGHHVLFDLASKNPLTVPLRVATLRKHLKKIQPDILHARSRVPAWLTFFANSKLALPFVTTVHGFNSVNSYSRVMTFGDKVICVSGAIRDHIQKHYDVSGEKLIVIPRGVDLDLFDPARLDHDFIETFSREYMLSGKFVVTSVGRITQLKDYETFIRGVISAGEKIPGVCGLIVGGVRKDKEQYFQSLQELVRELNGEKIIRFVGSQSKIPEIYALSKIIVSCSKKPESFGRSAAESLAMNIPVLATNHGGVLDIIQEGRDGYFFNPGNAEELAALILKQSMETTDNLRDSIVKRFTLANMVEETTRVYRALR